MSRYYDKAILKSSIEPEQVFDLLERFEGSPTWGDNCIISDTICHNVPGEGSHKLYYYCSSKLFHCFTQCSDSFDIFELCIKVMRIQYHLEWELYDAMDYIAQYFGFSGIEQEEEKLKLKDWDIFKRHAKSPTKKIQRLPLLKSYDASILDRFTYPRILSWEQEGISDTIIKRNKIGYYAGGEQIVIPHFDIEGRLIGIRGRCLADEEANRYGKYRPISVNRVLYSHPLSMNLYNLNNSQETIRKTKVVVVFESEKACLAYQTAYGIENDISVACCGSSLSSYQCDLLKSLGVNEMIIAFDRDFAEIGDETFKRMKARLIHLYNKYNNSIRVTAIFDKRMILPQKASPIDVSKEVFETLMRERIVPCERID